MAMGGDDGGRQIGTGRGNAAMSEATELAAYKIKLVLASIADNLQHNGQPSNNDLRIWKLVLGQALKDLQGDRPAY